jgi:hypothetical protein
MTTFRKTSHFDLSFAAGGPERLKVIIVDPQMPRAA